jgi:hypothetical protein
MLMASTGHSSTQTPQSTHLSATTNALPLRISMASLGQASTHDSHPVHVLASTFAGIVNPFPKHWLIIRKQAGEFTKFPPATQ